MADITQSFSQLLLIYGPDAMLDLPEHAVVVSGLQGWRYGSGWTPLEEDRLVPLLRQQLGDKLSPSLAGLRQPPSSTRRSETSGRLGSTSRSSRPGSSSTTMAAMPMLHPPEPRSGDGWSSCMICPPQRRTSSPTGGGQTPRGQPDPLRRCLRRCGHLQDIEWRFLTHRSGDRTCRKPLYWVERGVSSDPGDISIRCTCGASISLADLYKPKFLGDCKCRSPWLPRPAEVLGSLGQRWRRPVPRI